MMLFGTHKTVKGIVSCLILCGLVLAFIACGSDNESLLNTTEKQEALQDKVDCKEYVGLGLIVKCRYEDGILAYLTAQIEGYDIIGRNFNESNLTSQVDWFFGGIKIISVNIIAGDIRGSALFEFTDEDYNFSSILVVEDQLTKFTDIMLFEEEKLVIILGFIKFRDGSLVWRTYIIEGELEQYKIVELRFCIDTGYKLVSFYYYF